MVDLTLDYPVVYVENLSSNQVLNVRIMPIVAEKGSEADPYDLKVIEELRGVDEKLLVALPKMMFNRIADMQRSFGPTLTDDQIKIKNALSAECRRRCHEETSVVFQVLPKLNPGQRLRMNCVGAQGGRYMLGVYWRDFFFPETATDDVKLTVLWDQLNGETVMRTVEVLPRKGNLIETKGIVNYGSLVQVATGQGLDVCRAHSDEVVRVCPPYFISPGAPCFGVSKPIVQKQTIVKRAVRFLRGLLRGR